MKSLKKYNIGSPKRTTKKTRTSLKKYDIGLPRRPNQTSMVIEEEEVMITPNTPRSRKWKEWEKKGKQGYISDYEEDVTERKERKKRGIHSPSSYTNFEKIKTRYMSQAYKKKPLTDTIEQVDEEEWEQKKDDTPTRNPGTSLLGGRRSRGRGSRGRGSRGRDGSRDSRFYRQ